MAVWGPTGAPGRTTVAVGLATELASRGRGTLLLDADPYGGAVAQHLGVLDQALLAAVQAREIDPDDAYRYATDKKALQKFVTDTSLVPKLEVAAPPSGGGSSPGGG